MATVKVHKTVKDAAAKAEARRQRRRRRKRRLRKTRVNAGHFKRRRRHPKKKLYYSKSRFSLKRLRKVLNNLEIVIAIDLSDEPFAKPVERLYSFYRFQPIPVKVYPDGTIQGGVLTFVFAWIDWSFVRELVAPFYSQSTEGGWAWDPVTLFLLDLLRVLLGYSSRAKLLAELEKGTAQGKEVARLVGIDLANPAHPDHRVPQEMTFTHFRDRISPEVYQAVMHVVIGLLRQLGLITGLVLSFDSLLVETWAVFEGCGQAGQAGHGCETCPHFVGCTQVPFDLEAGVGHRRAKKGNRSEIEAVYSYAVHTIVSFEVNLGMEFTMALLVTHGGVYDGHYFEALLEQMEQYQPGVKAVFHLADAHYDDLKNYIAARQRGAKPLFTYNRRREDWSEEALRRKGHNQHGWPYAPCGIAMGPQGFDEAQRTVRFACGRQCPQSHETCAYRHTGYATDIEVGQADRLILEIPRGSWLYKVIFALRSSVERNNDHLADHGLRRPQYHGQRNMTFNACLSAIASLFDKAFSLFQEGAYQEAQPERHDWVDFSDLPLLDAIVARWLAFRTESADAPAVGPP
jgi:hypothetical protein